MLKSICVFCSAFLVLFGSFSNDTPTGTIDMGRGLAADATSMTRVVTDSTLLSYNDCENWSLTTDDLLGLLDQMSESSLTLSMTYCYAYPCFYELSGTYNGADCKIEVGAGSSVVIKTKASSTYFILEDEDPRFIAACDCCE